MHGPDGTDWPNVTLYHEVEPLARLVYDHGATDTTPPLFRVTVTFTAVGDKTRLDMTMALATPEIAAQTRRFIKEAGGEATWDRLAEFLDLRTSGRERFVLNRAFDAPIARVFAMWTEREHLARWLPPRGATMRLLDGEIAVGRRARFVMTGAQGALHGHFEYLAIEPPRRVAYLQRFTDEAERPTRPPGAPDWPLTLLTTVVLVEESPERTRVVIATEPQAPLTDAEVAAFVAERAGMTRGWTGSLDVLEELLAALA
jgi:uncharacterized protein YndB with AHSA1/START domain